MNIQNLCWLSLDPLSLQLKMNLSIPEMVKQNIYLAMSHWERHTCIEFVNRTTEDDYIEFEPGSCGLVPQKQTFLDYLKIEGHLW